MPTILRRLRPLLPIVLVFVLALGLRLYRLDAQSLWLDEGGSWAEVTGRTGKGWGELIFELFSADAGYPLYHLGLKGWVMLAGESEWALRFPSALAGALAVLVLARLGMWGCEDLRLWSCGNAGMWVGLVAATSPFLLWHAQDAKAYSLLLLMVSVLFLAALHALRTGGRAWLWVLLIALISVFVHRLALLAVASAALGVFFETRGQVNKQRMPFPGFRLLLLGIAVLGAIAGLVGTMRAAGGERAFISRSGVGPFQSLWLTLLRFSVDRWPGDLNGFLGLPLLVWLLPFVMLGIWGLLLLLRDALAGWHGAAFLLCVFAMPLLLVMLLTAFSPIYEARYTIVAFPGWLLLLTYPGARGQWSEGIGQPRKAAASLTHVNQGLKSILIMLRPYALTILVVLVSVVTLFQPKKGLFSGDALKEQWREAVQYMAQHAQPDDLLLIHPSYVELMYDYYAPRVTPDPLPAPVTFPVFAEGDLCDLKAPTQTEVRLCWARRYEPFFNMVAFGKKRALLLISPDHARTVDPPKSLAELIIETPQDQPLPIQGDRYGWVGLRFQYPQDTWPCGGTGNALIGVEVMCQSYPDSFNASGPGMVPEPDTALQADFGNILHLRGFSIKPFGNRLHPGGTLPITLYWWALEKPTQNYRMFLHLCRDCRMPPLANNDGPPLSGLFPAGETSSWRAQDPVHDERSLTLPADLAPGRYTLLLGVYAGDGSEASRLTISNTMGEVLSAGRLVLGQIEIAEQ